MESYLREAPFQTKPPKLLIFEMEERDLRSPPTFQHRAANFNIDNTEWLLRVSALIQTSCKVSTVTASIAPAGLGAVPSNQKGGGITTGPTSDTDFVDVVFSGPLGKLDYLWAKLPSSASKPIILEASGSEAEARKFITEATGAGALKYPLTSPGKGYTKVRIFPGKTTGFSLQDLQICRQPDHLLS